MCWDPLDTGGIMSIIEGQYVAGPPSHRGAFTLFNC